MPATWCYFFCSKKKKKQHRYLQILKGDWNTLQTLTNSENRHSVIASSTVAVHGINREGKSPAIFKQLGVCGAHKQKNTSRCALLFVSMAVCALYSFLFLFWDWLTSPWFRTESGVLFLQWKRSPKEVPAPRSK